MNDQFESPSATHLKGGSAPLGTIGAWAQGLATAPQPNEFHVNLIKDSTTILWEVDRSGRPLGPTVPRLQPRAGRDPRPLVDSSHFPYFTLPSSRAERVPQVVCPEIGIGRWQIGIGSAIAKSGQRGYVGHLTGGRSKEVKK